MKKFYLLAFVSFFSLFVVGCTTPANQSPQSAMKSVSLEEAQTIAEAFVNEELLPAGQSVEILSFVDNGDLFKMNMNIGEQNIDAYLSKDGENFFPQVMNIETVKKQKEEAAKAAEEQKAQELSAITKQDVVDVELFIMSHCPFGTQMEKGIIPVIETLGDSVNFELKFNSYAMHDKKEIEEQILQHCIKTETPDQLFPYLKCFLEAGDTQNCLPKINATTDTYASCIENVEMEYSIWTDYEDKSTWNGRFPTFSIYKDDNEAYGVQGSPTLVINGKVVRTARDSATLLDAICAGFENAPEACDAELSSAAPTPGFGYGTTPGATSDASCG